MTTRRAAQTVVALSLGLATIGCSTKKDDLPREPVSGKVTMDDQPLPEAVIQFYPTGDAKATPSVGANAEIKDGQYSIPREDGLVPGSYKVSISHQVLKEPTGKAKTKGTPSRSKILGPEQIPARYNSKSELKAEIKPGGTRDLDFPLQSK